jgi:hypothetical protein
MAGVAALLAGTWDIGERAPDAPSQLSEFEFVIGCFHIDAQLYDRETNAYGPTAPTYWNGRWALNGWAVYDEWFDVQIPGQPPALGRGANLRVVNPETGVWTMVWAHTNGTPGQDLRAQMRAGDMVMWAVHPLRENDWKAVFEIIDDDHWVRTEYARQQASDTWLPVARLNATQIACDQVRVH